jgi:hypothetical protein
LSIESETKEDGSKVIEDDKKEDSMSKSEENKSGEVKLEFEEDGRKDFDKDQEANFDST